MAVSVAAEPIPGTAGAVFWRVDLHVHTPASPDAEHYGASSASEILDAAERVGLNAIAITDHNTAEWCDAMTEAALVRGVIVLPGAEISTSEGHLLGIWEEGTPAAQITAVLHQLGFTPQQLGRTTECSKFGFAEAGAIITDSGGLAIPAHIDKPKGLLGLPVPFRIKEVLRSSGIAAVEVTDLATVSDVQKKIGGKRVLACVRGSDAPSPEETGGHSAVGIGARSTWIKAARPDLRGLQHAFDDPALRVRLDAPEPAVHPAITSVSVTGGFFDGETFEFSEDLNCLLGGTGTGKSLLIEIIRFGLGQQTSRESFPKIREEVDSRLDRALGTNSTVRIDLKIGEAEFTVCRAYSGADSPAPEVESVRGAAKSVDAGLIKLRAFSQSEIIEYAREPVGRMDLVDAALDLTDLDEREEEAAVSLEANGATVVKLCRQIESTENALERLPEVERKLAELTRFFDSGIVEQQQAWSQERLRLGGLTERIGCAAIATIANVEPFDHAVANSENEDLYNRATSAHTALNEAIDQANGAVKRASANAQAELAAIADEWRERNSAFEARLAARLQEYDGGKLGLPALQRQLQELQTIKAELDDTSDRLDTRLRPSLRTAFVERDEITSQIEEIRRERRARRQERIQHLNALMKDEVLIKLEKEAEDKAFGEELVRLGKGSNLRKPTYDLLRKKSDPVRLVRSYLNGDAAAVADATGAPLVDVQKLFDTIKTKGKETELLELQSFELHDHLIVKFRPAGTGQYEEIERLAHGQKCTAILILAMADGTEPLIVDQPEDALHAPWIEEHLVDRLRDLRGARQYILATRSPGLVVSADAEMIITLAAVADKGGLEASGSLERHDLNRLALYHLEGGPVPFQRRHGKLAVSVRQR
ncbi:PHP domain-containing protein [Glycomyces niveus]|uniref:AAA family ATPase n=1 Tax=Glycomyces niveus TaxID=2820287 RepID=A0ABS3U1U9_9ACTN|nr:PHP domain-containing protein [Glycomyces sp. NEAU-S30]MBO3732749.1 AAA family ATPase [Glycomyces sp. NEAU-S30]